jgi:transposase
MKAPIYVRELTPQEHNRLEIGLHSKEALTLRRSQILLASSRKLRPSQIGSQLGCSAQAVRDVIHLFEKEGLARCLTRQSTRPKTRGFIFDEVKSEELKEMLHQSPRQYGKNTSLWNLGLAAEVSFTEGITQRQVSAETIRQALKRLKVNWKRAKNWINSPDPDYVKKKHGGTG